MSMQSMPDRVVPDLEVRLEEAVGSFRAHHRDPANVAMHVAAYGIALRAGWRFLRGHRLQAIVDGASAVGLVVLGHRIEGSEPFTSVRSFLRPAGPAGP